jgi:hypothetical protein
MLQDLWAAILSIPEGVLKAIGAIVGGSFATGFYLWGRLRTLHPPADAPGPRVSLSETDRELGFTLIRTGTALTRALNEHGEALRRRRNPRT